MLPMGLYRMMDATRLAQWELGPLTISAMPETINPAENNEKHLPAAVSIAGCVTPWCARKVIRSAAATDNTLTPRTTLLSCGGFQQQGGSQYTQRQISHPVSLSRVIVFEKAAACAERRSFEQNHSSRNGEKNGACE